MSVYKGTAYASRVDATGTRFFAARLGSADADPATREDGASWDLAASAGALTFHLTTSVTGLTPPAVPDQYVVELRHADTNTVVSTATVAGAATTATLYATNTGAAGGTPLIGDFRVYLRAIRTSLGTYDVNSDTLNFRGFVRVSPITMTAQMWHTGPSNPASYDDFIEVNIDLSHSPGLDLSHRHFDVKAINATTEVLYATQRTEGTDPQNALMKVDNRFPSEQVNVAIDIEVVAVPSSIAPDSEPDAVWMLIPDGTTDKVTGKRIRKGPVQVDATIWLNHHLQVNTNVYNPLLDQDSRLTSDLGFVTTVVTNSRDEPLAGITFHSLLQDAGNLVPPAVDYTPTTDATGKPPTMQAWDSQLPGGLWIHSGEITGPADAIGLEFHTGDERTLLSANPALSLITGCGPSSANTDERHLEPGMEVLIGLTVANVFTGQSVDVDAGSAEAAVARFNLSLARAEFLDLDGVWKSVAGNTIYFWPLLPSPGDPMTHLTIFSEAMTADWGVSDLFIVGKASVGGIPLTNFMKEVVVQGVNNHNSYKFDGAGFVGFPTR